MSQRLKQGVFFLVIFIVGLLISLPVTSEHRFLEYDDFFLVAPLAQISNLSEYQRGFDRGEIVDINPIRDLSYWLELKIYQHTGLINHQAINYVFWFVAVLLLFLILQQLSISSPLKELVILLVMFHPLQSSVYWIASRKHILSVMFLMTAALLLISSKKGRSSIRLVLSLVFYILSILSQPITLGFPVFAFLWIRTNGGLKILRNKIYLSLLALVGALVAVINLQYYKSAAYKMSGGLYASKFQELTLESLLRRFLIWGRDLFQLFIPVKPAVGSFNLFAIEAYVGIGILVFFIFMVWRWRKFVSWEWLALMWAPILVVTATLTSQGGMDTYLLTPLFAGAVFVATTIQKRNLQVHTLIKLVCFLLVGCFIFINYKMAKVWQAPETLWTYAYESEKAEAALLNYLQISANNPSANQDELWQLALPAYQKNPQAAQWGYILGKLIADKKVTPDEREKLFSSFNLRSPWFYFFWSLSDAKNGKFQKAHERLQDLWKENATSFLVLMRYDLDTLEEKWTKICVLAEQTNCEDIHLKIEEEKLRSLRSH